jgi:hypothetical protein
MFHQSGKVSGHIICIWELENPHIQRMVVWDSPKVNMLCGLMKGRIIGQVFFVEATVTDSV